MEKLIIGEVDISTVNIIKSYKLGYMDCDGATVVMTFLDMVGKEFTFLLDINDGKSFNRDLTKVVNMDFATINI